MWKSAAGTFGLKVSSAILGFGLNLLLTKTLGAKAFGSYVYALAWLNFLVVPATLGLDVFGMRQVAIYHGQKAWAPLRGLLKWQNQISAAAACLVGIVFALLIWLLNPNPEQRVVIWVGLLALPIIALRNLRISVMKGLSQVVRGSIPEMVAHPLGVIVLTLVGYLGFRTYFSVYWVMGSYVLTSLLTLGLGWQLLRQVEPPALQQVMPHFRQSVWIRQTLPFLSLGMITILNSKITILVLGAWQGSAAAGIFGLAEQISLLITFSLMAINGTLAPTVAKLYTQGEKEKLQQVITKSARMAAFATVPAALVMILLAPWILNWFGREFVAGATTLQILCLGQLINGVSGSVVLILNMTGHEKSAITSLVTAVILNILLSVILIPVARVEGAAIASAISMVVWNVISAVLVYRKTGLHPTALGRLG